MQWCCPHCGVKLAVADDRLGHGWSFSRCYKCGGFALVKRSDVNLIKVDKAPSGEPILLPEGSERPVMPRAATERLAAFSPQQPAARPVIRPAQPRRASAATSQAPQAPQVVETSAPNSASAISFPDPIPEEEAPSALYRALPAAIGIAAITAVGSGIYVVYQGQALWAKARTAHAEAPVAVEPAPSAAPTVAAIEVTDQLHAAAMAPARDEPAQQTPPTPMRVRLTGPTANLHSGPGIEFPVIGVANPTMTYQVKEWKDRWFKIEIPEDQQTSGRATAAWVRNDLVQTITQ